MKNILLILILVVLGTQGFAQKGSVGVGTTNPDQSAILEISSTNKGFLLPRMTENQRLEIANPAEGLKVYQIDKTKGEYTFDGIQWINSVAGSDDDWTTTGNNGTSPFHPVTNTSGNAIGTNDGQPIVFKIGLLRAGYLESSNRTTFIGLNSGLSNTGSGNLGLGFDALKLNSTGRFNSAVGTFSMMANTIGEDNAAFGYSSLSSNTEGNWNMAIGSSALASNTIGNNNVAIGLNSLLSSIDKSDNVAIGTRSLGNLKGENNIGIGSLSGFSVNDLSSTGSNNIFIGKQSGYNIKSGSFNTLIGNEAGYTNETGSGNVFIGFRAGTNEVNPSNKLYIANNQTSNPLIKGEFDNQVLKIHTGSAAPTATTGYMAIGDFSANGSTSTAGTGGINTFPAFTASSKYRLIVQDGLITEKVKVALRNGADWADYVFEPSYKLMPLEAVESFTKENKHLPNVPSADEMATNGLDVGETSKMFMEKIEELTLYMIELNKEVKALKAENEILKRKLK